MAKVINIGDVAKKKQKLYGQSFSPQELFDFIVSLGLASLLLVWDEPCNIAFFFQREHYEPEEIAYLDLEDWDEGDVYLVITLDNEVFRKVFEYIGNQIMLKFGAETILATPIR